MSVEPYSANIPSEEWIDIEYVGKKNSEMLRYERDNIRRAPQLGYNWTFTPSGKIGAHYRVVRDDVCYLFTFVDFVEKICFEIPLCYNEPEYEGEDENMHTFYFSADEELIVICGQEYEFKQLVYKINVIDQQLELQETITRKLVERNEDVEHVSECVDRQEALFITYEGIDYVVLVSYEGNSVINNIKVRIFSIYLVPKYPMDKNIPMKEFQAHCKIEDLNHLCEKVRANITYEDNIIIARLDEFSCLINGSKLIFSFKLDYHEDDDDEAHLLFYLGTLVGEYWEVDLANLKDVLNVTTAAEYRQLMLEQDNFGKFIQHDGLNMSNSLYLHCFDKDVGIVSIYYDQNRNSKPKAIVCPPNMPNRSVPITLSCEIEEACKTNRYVLHPHGALLQLSFTEGLRLRVLKCLKTNLKLLALNHTLFHKNTPIKNHPVYKLCFKEHYKYNNITIKRASKRKLPEE